MMRFLNAFERESKVRYTLNRHVCNLSKFYTLGRQVISNSIDKYISAASASHLAVHQSTLFSACDMSDTYRSQIKLRLARERTFVMKASLRRIDSTALRLGLSIA